MPTATQLTEFWTSYDAFAVDIAPLFESGDSLRSAGKTMRDLLANPGYRAHLDARDVPQPMLVGYSQASRDSGYMGMRLAVYDAHEDVPRQILTKQWIPAVLRAPLSWAFERYENAQVKRLAGVVAATPHIAERFAAAGIEVTEVVNHDDSPTGASPEVNESTFVRSIYFRDPAGNTDIHVHVAITLDAGNFGPRPRGAGLLFFRHIG